VVDAVLSAVRQTPHRLLGPLRYNAAIRAVERTPRLGTVLVICHGNICRSPFAEAALRRLLRQHPVAVGSAGIMGPGRRPPDAALRAAHDRGIDMSAHCSRLVTPELLQRADLVVVMDAQQARTLRDRFGISPRKVVLLGDFDSDRKAPRAITDPYAGSDAVFDAVYGRIERCVRPLAEAVGRHLPEGPA
jgi:protein-tyrosine phosphatase